MKVLGGANALLCNWKIWKLHGEYVRNFVCSGRDRGLNQCQILIFYCCDLCKCNISPIHLIKYLVIVAHKLVVTNLLITFLLYFSWTDDINLTCHNDDYLKSRRWHQVPQEKVTIFIASFEGNVTVKITQVSWFNSFICNSVICTKLVILIWMSH